MNSIHVLTDYHSQMLSSIFDHSHSEKNAQWFNDCYCSLYLWINQCLDCYKLELQKILFPIFVHFIIDLLLKNAMKNAQELFFKYHSELNELHSQDIQQLNRMLKLAANPMQSHKKSNLNLSEFEMYEKYRSYKYHIQISHVSHSLLMSFLNASKLNLVIICINNHLHFSISKYEPIMNENDLSHHRRNDLTSNSLPFGINHEKVSQMNDQSLEWGMARSMDIIESKALRDRMSTHLSYFTAVNINNNNKRLMRTEFAETHVSQPKLSKESENRLLTEIKNRVYAGANRLPSVCSYEFVNSANVINCTSVSTNGRWIIGGGMDSVLRLYDVQNTTRMKIDEQKNEIDMDVKSAENESKHCYKLIGHRSSIFSVSFHENSEFFLSSSADGSIGLWSCEKQRCLAFYRSHMFPVWDTKFSPFGLYFASASLDKSARLWSTDRAMPLRIFGGHLLDVQCLRFHPNCNYLATGSALSYSMTMSYLLFVLF